MIGRVDSARFECEKTRLVRIFKKRPGADRRIATTMTTDAGQWRLRLGRTRGVFYARVAKVTVTDSAGASVECGNARSAEVYRY